MNNKRIVFMGTPVFASKILKGLIDKQYNIVLVVTQPDKEVGRKRILKASSCKEVALSNNIDVFTPISLKDDYSRIIEANPDLIITCAYGQFLPKGLLDIPPLKCINIHGSLLPKYRGGSPIQRSIINGEKKTGITIMYMNEFMDQGDILFQKSIDIDENDTSTILFDKLSSLGLECILEFLPKFFNNDFTPIKQDNSLATIAKNISKDDEHIDFNDDVKNVYNHIRGLLDNPGCYFICEGIKYKIHEVSYELDNDTRPSYIYGLVNDYFKIGCVNGFIKIYMIQKESKNKCSAKEFNNGFGKTLIGKNAR